jgi:selenide,water dikinase
MNKSDAPIVKDLVLVGGGHSHVTVLKRFGMKPLPGVRLTIICRDVHTPYSGMLPGYIAGHYDFDDAHIDLGPLAQFANARFYHDEAVGLDLANKKVICRGRPPVSYDVLSINIGSTPRIRDIPGAQEHVVPVKPINNFISRWERLAERVQGSSGTYRIGVVGAGAGGVELTLAVQYRLGKLLGGADANRLEFNIFTDTDDILPTHNARVRAKYNRVLAARGVQVHTNRRVAAVTDSSLRFADGGDIALDDILWVTMAGAAPWLADAGLDIDDGGFIRVDDNLQALNHPEVFAAGDIATMVNHPREKAGVFAVRQGKPLARNLRRALTSKPLRPFAPQRKFLSLISTGDKYAVASRANWALEGRYVWRWKDWIDRRFMRKYNELPEMDEDEAPKIAAGLADQAVIKEISAIAMRCGGCGAKVGSTVLTRALGQLEPVQRNDILIGLHEPDDAAVVEVPPGKVMIHTVDFFRSFIDDPYVFGQVAANHAMGDIFAMGGDPQSALAVATVPYGIESKVEDTLFQMMSGAIEVLRTSNTSLVGGHTGEGAELSLGFSVNGVADREGILIKGGMRPGDKLILTKGIGTGTLFAADMRLKAKGRWITGALESMLLSNYEGAKIMHAHGATACTDVTGFGLLGHLVEMTKPSEVDVELRLQDVPLLDGALETVQLGIFSSLQPENVRLRRAIRDLERVSDHDLYPLIFDPQTAGGLLASIPGDQAEACRDALIQAGYPRTAIIGEVLPQGDALEPVTLVA